MLTDQPTFKPHGQAIGRVGSRGDPANAAQLAKGHPQWGCVDAQDLRELRQRAFEHEAAGDGVQDAPFSTNHGGVT